jgi:hypothetical protein
MCVGVNAAGHYILARCIDDLCIGWRVDIPANGGNPTPIAQYIRLEALIGVNDRSVLYKYRHNEFLRSSVALALVVTSSIQWPATSARLSFICFTPLRRKIPIRTDKLKLYASHAGLI